MNKEASPTSSQTDVPADGQTAEDRRTAQAFASSWNNLPEGSVYTRDQFEDWLAPVTEADVRGRTVLEMGCGNASLLAHMAAWGPARIRGVDLGDSVLSARANMQATGHPDWAVDQADLTEFQGDGADLAYCIGVLHHLKDPRKGFDAVLRNVQPGGRFHCWVYAREGNGVIITLVEPLRRIFSRCPWWFTKYCAATPLVAPYYLYAKALAACARVPGLKALTRHLPLHDYSLWIAKREFAFFRHVAFDQLVTPQTTYIPRETVDAWLASNPHIDPDSTYVILRNGNSWKFGGRMRGNDSQIDAGAGA